MSTITKEFTKEQLIEQANKNIEVLRGAAERIPGASDAAVIHLKLAEITLASLEAEAVYQVLTGDAWVDLSKGAMDSQKRVGAFVRTVYTAPPVPVSVPDERYQHLSELYRAQEKRLFKLAQRIKGPSFDKYAHSPSQAIDVLELVIFGERADEACRAAMLQGAEHVTTTNKLGNSPAIPDGLRLALSNAGIAAPESDEMLAATCEKYIQALVTWVKDRKPFQPAAPDFREILNSSTNNFLENTETSTKCWCRTCRPITLTDMRFVVCPDCGNKRCPHANDHRNACSGSNEPGQEGSAYPAAPQQEPKP